MECLRTNTFLNIIQESFVVKTFININTNLLSKATDVPAVRAIVRYKAIQWSKIEHLSKLIILWNWTISLTNKAVTHLTTTHSIRPPCYYGHLFQPGLQCKYIISWGKICLSETSSNIVEKYMNGMLLRLVSVKNYFFAIFFLILASYRSNKAVVRIKSIK